ncbi:unnamed protein product [Rhodiola kirilowii]
MESALQMEELALTSGASGRIIPILRNLNASFIRAIVFVRSLFLCIIFFLRRRRRRIAPLSPSSRDSPSFEVDEKSASSVRRRSVWRRIRDEEAADVLRRRALAERVVMVEDGSEVWCGIEIFYGVRRNALFCRHWLPASGELSGIMIIIHGLNEHGGRYSQFASQLTSYNYGVYAMDWTGHGGSDGLHGYVPSLDYVIADTGALLEKIKLENVGVPCFLYGHSTGGAVVLKAASHLHIEKMLEGIILTSPALRVKPAHPIVGAVAPIFSLVAPRFQFKGANKRGIPVSRDPAALLAKYSDPLVYTGPIRVRTGHEILRISSYLTKNFKSVNVPFFVLHGTADTVTDPQASQDLYNEAPSSFKDIKLYEGFLHDLLFEPEREEIAQDIINWMEKKLRASD